MCVCVCVCVCVMWVCHAALFVHVEAPTVPTVCRISIQHNLRHHRQVLKLQVNKKHTQHITKIGIT